VWEKKSLFDPSMIPLATSLLKDFRNAREIALIQVDEEENKQKDTNNEGEHAIPLFAYILNFRHFAQFYLDSQTLRCLSAGSQLVFAAR
jgi:hypothetical protein